MPSSTAPLWLDLPRAPRNAKRDPNPVVCGRKFCATCGRWRLLVDFHVQKRSITGTPIYWFASCVTCERQRKRQRDGHSPKRYGRTSSKELSARARAALRDDPERLAARREYMRMYKEAERRRRGVPERKFSRESKRTKGKQASADAVDAGPFLRWLSTVSVDREDDLAQLAGVSTRFFSRARMTGRASITNVDRILIAAGGDTMLWELYPELYA